MIDWFTVFAQLINFLILITLLKYFLYGRIMDAIENREQSINEQNLEAQQNLKKAQVELDWASQKNQQIDEQREQLLGEIKADVDKFRKKRMAEVKSEIDDMQSRWSYSIRQEQEAFLDELRIRTADSVCMVARQALTDLADERLETQIVSRFLNNVSALDDHQRRSLVETLTRADQIAVIQTTLELPDELKNVLVSGLERELQTKLHVRFETIADLQCGIALQTNSHRLGWNIRDYLMVIEDDLRSMINDQTAAKRKRP